MDVVTRDWRLALGGSAWVVAQIGQSLDGRVATVTGHSHYVNGAPALRHLHELRAMADAVVVGVGTVIADDPQLTVRLVAGANPVRVVIDPRGRAPGHARCFAEDGVRRLVLRLKAQVGPGAVASGVEVESLSPDADGRLSPVAIIERLSALGLRKILVEGGPSTVSAFLAAGALDRLHLLVAPVLIGSGLPGLSLPPIQTMDQALRPVVHSHLLGEGEFLFDCDMRAMG